MRDTQHYVIFHRSFKRIKTFDILFKFRDMKRLMKAPLLMPAYVQRRKVINNNTRCFKNGYKGTKVH